MSLWGHLRAAGAAALLALASAACAAAPLPDVARCSWANPGAHPYGGTASAALDRLAGHFSTHQLQALHQAVAARQWTDVVQVSRDSILGALPWRPMVEMMNFDTGRLCAQVDRSMWAADMVLGAIVYCAPGAAPCVAWFAICRNWALVWPGTAGSRASTPPSLLAGEPSAPLLPITDVAAPPPLVASSVASSAASPVRSAEPAPQLGPLELPPTGAGLPAMVGGPLLPRVDVPAGPQGLPPMLPLLPVPPIPDAPTWATMLAGLLGIHRLARARLWREGTAQGGTP
jgi:hypothetical protein